MQCFFCTIHAAWPWLRQTGDGRGGMGQGEEVRFVLEDKNCRAWCLRHANVFARLTRLLGGAPPDMRRPAMPERAEMLYGTNRRSMAALHEQARR